MVMLLLLFSLLTAPAFAAPLTFTFNGSLADGGTITGSLSYDSTESASSMNVRGLANNAVYNMSSYAFTVQPVYSALPHTISYAPELTTAEFCVGNCVFGSPSVMNLRFLDGLHALQLTFAPTQDLGQWGTLVANSSELKSFNADGSFNSLMMVTSGGMTPVNVPEPATWLLLAGGLLGLGWYGYRRGY